MSEILSASIDPSFETLVSSRADVKAEIYKQDNQPLYYSLHIFPEHISPNLPDTVVTTLKDLGYLDGKQHKVLDDNGEVDYDYSGVMIQNDTTNEVQAKFPIPATEADLRQLVQTFVEMAEGTIYFNTPTGDFGIQFDPYKNALNMFVVSDQDNPKNFRPFMNFLSANIDPSTRPDLQNIMAIVFDQFKQRPDANSNS